MIDRKLEEVFTVNIDILQEGAKSSGGGLALSDKNGVNQIYFLVLTEDGNFQVVKRDSSGLKYLVDYPDSKINPSGEINTLTIYKEEPDYYFFINDLLVAKVIIEDFVIDSLGVVVNVGSEEPVTCYFDNLEVYDLN